MGAITPIGNSVESFWESVKQEKIGFAPITHFDTAEYKCKLAAEVKNFNPEDYMDKKSARRMELFSMPLRLPRRPWRTPVYKWIRKTLTWWDAP